jgi:AcrR family transcriptional regulator
MARARFQKLAPAKQEAILAAAADEFAERGFEGASLNRIIERAGSSKGSIYYYFEDKADLLVTVVERAVADVLGGLDLPSLEEFTAEDYWDRLKAVFEQSVPLLEMDTWYMRVIRSFYRLRDEPGAPVVLSQVMDQGKDLAGTMLARGVELGVVRTDLPLELLVELYLAADQAGDRWLLRHWDDFGSAERQALMAARMDLVRDMLDASHVGWDR